MFIIGNEINNCNEVIRIMIGDNNINLINDYFNNYYAVCYNDQELKTKMDMLYKLDCKFKNACLDGMGLVPYFQFAKLYSLSNNLDNLQEQVNEKRNDLDFSLFRLEIDNSDIKESNIYNRLENTHGLHAFCKYMNPYLVDITDEDLLLDEVLNNELDLIRDFFDDYRCLNFDVRLAKKRKSSYINHDINKLDLRLQNIVMQNEVLNVYKDSDVDAAIVNEIINDSYSLLVKSFSEGVSYNEISNYKEILNFNLPEKEKNMNKAIKKYVSVTLDEINNFGKIIDCKKKVK